MGRSNIRLAVLCGGTSPEREVSLESGANVAAALERLGYAVELVDLTPAFFEAAIQRRFDGVFIALHGSPGEDGTVQGFLDLLRIPYAGSGVVASSIAMDKRLTKMICQSSGLKVARYVHGCATGVHGEPLSLVRAESVGYPSVVKPVRLGSSVGVSIAHDRGELSAALTSANKLDCCVIVEEFVRGREIQCGIVGRNRPWPLPLIEIVPKRPFFDYDAKYTPGLAEEIAPAPLDEETTRAGQEVAMATFRALGCRDVARVDMFLTEEGEYVVSEVNTIPGLTANSLLPKEAGAAGMGYDDLVAAIVEGMVEEIEEERR